MEMLATWCWEHSPKVLILIIMEDTHGEHDCAGVPVNIVVLILIIMEDTHGGQDTYLLRNQITPCI